MRIALALSAAFALLLSHPLPLTAGSPDCVVVFNEIHYNPSGMSEDGEWVELFNQMGIKTDVSGWRIDGIGYTFPQGTVIDPGGYLVVAKSSGPGQLGYPGSIGNDGELLVLYNQSNRLMDEVDFGDSGRWPVGPDGSGATLAKRAPYTANKPSENWATSAQVGGTPGAVNFPAAGQGPPPTTVPLLSLGSTWRFNEQGSDLGSGWAATAHAVDGTAWRFGPGVHAFESGLAQPVGTSLRFPNANNPYVITYYFETEFTLSGAQVAALQSLQLRHLIDDGAVFHVNGVEVARAGMPAGPVTAATLASANIEATLSATLPIPTGSLVAGANRISVEVHQFQSGSSDVVFGLELEAVIAGAIPGGAPAIRLSEVPPAGGDSYWVEITNSGAIAHDVGGMILSVGGDAGREYVLPAQSLAAGDFLVLDEATLGFRPLDGENLFLYDAPRGTVLDARRQTNRLRGRADARDGAWLYPDTATPGEANSFIFQDGIVVSEIHYNPPALAPVPATPATYATTALIGYNDTWRYNDGNENLPSDWAGAAHAVGGNWKSAPAVFGFETSVLSQPIVTQFPNPGLANPFVVAYYFEREFMVTAPLLGGLDSLSITHQIDDGAVFYLNGTEVGRFNMPAGAVTPETLATPSVGDATLQTLVIPGTSLLVGTNRLSVELHQASVGSSDVVFGLKLDALAVVTPATPAQPLRNSDNQWVELANRSAAPIDLGGWSFADGLDFVFPVDTQLAPGEHACLVRDPAVFAAAYPGARVLGVFGGSLSRTGERLDLVDAFGNPADLVRYFDSGRWPVVPDGGGASLELRDIDADNSVPEAWAASDESAQTGWKSYSYRGPLAASRGPDGQWSEFNLGLLAEGEILIDDLSVIENPDGAATQKLTNTTFTSGAAGWRLRGTHRLSTVIDDPESPGNKVLRIVATGPTEHMHNQIETTLASPAVNGREYQISFRARWVSGSNQLLTRLYFHRLPRVTVIDRPADVGTPSAVNSRALANLGPTVASFLHSPPVPAVAQAVTVTAQAADPEGVAAMSLLYSVNGGVFQTVAMAPAGSGKWQGAIPGQAAAAVVQFYVTATDGAGAVSTFPLAGPDSRALYKVNDNLAATNGQHNFRIVVTNADRDFLHTTVQVMSNGRLGTTIIDRETDIYYDADVRLKGSERARSQSARVGYNLRFGSDQPYRGIHESLAIDRSEGVGTGQREILFDMMIANSGGVLSRYYDFIKVLAPQNQHTRSAVLQMARYDDVFLDSQFENGSDGGTYEYELIYYPTTADANGFKIPEPDGVTGAPVSDLGNDPETYRWFYLKKNHREADDFSAIIRYAKHFSKSGAAFETGLDEIVDVDGWLRGMAYGVLSGAGDNASAGDQHNGQYYTHPDGRVMFLPHDMDFSFDANRSVFANAECAKLTANLARRRLYFGHLHDIITTTYNNSYMSMWSTHLATFDASQPWSSHLSFINSRSNSVLSQINASIPSVAFAITTASPLVVNGSSATLSGTGWVNVRNIRVLGQAGNLAVTWLNGNTWQLTVPVPPGQSTVTLEALDFSGKVIPTGGTTTITINNTTTIEPASPANLAVSEIMYHPADPSASEIAAGFIDDDAFEYLELMNIGANPVNLAGASFIDGITHDLPSATVPPGARVILARDRAGFLTRYPAAGGSLLEGEFAIGTTNNLNNAGEQLVLASALGAVIRSFAYDDAAPWPASTDGTGYSLVLIAPESNPDHNLAPNWRSSALPGGNPGASDSVAFSGDPDGDDNSDGISNFLAHALGEGTPLPTLAPDPGNPGGFLFTYQRNLAADDVLSLVETSGNLTDWSTDGTVFAGTINLGNGTSLETWTAVPPPGAGTFFIRLRVQQR